MSFLPCSNEIAKSNTSLEVLTTSPFKTRETVEFVSTLPAKTTSPLVTVSFGF